MRVTANQRYIVVYLFVLLLGMHERDAALKREFNIISHMSLERALAQRFKQSSKSMAKVTNTNV